MSRWQWTPYLMSEDGKTRQMKLELGRGFDNIMEIQEFLRNMDTTHPHLKGAKITFEHAPVADT